MLIIDDSPVMCRFLEIFFSTKYTVKVCKDTLAALELLETGFEPDAIVTDLEMPGLNGVPFIQAIRGFLPYTPLFVVSGLNESKFRLAALQAGADDFVPKPFHPAELDIRVEKAIAQKTVGVSAETSTFNYALSWLPSLLSGSAN